MCIPRNKSYGYVIRLQAVSEEVDANNASGKSVILKPIGVIGTKRRESPDQRLSRPGNSRRDSMSSSLRL